MQTTEKVRVTGVNKQASNNIDRYILYVCTQCFLYYYYYCQMIGVCVDISYNKLYLGHFWGQKSFSFKIWFVNNVEEIFVMYIYRSCTTGGHFMLN